MAKRAGGCTRHRDGWVRWYKGKTRFVCGLKVAPGQVEDEWIKVKRQIDHEDNATARRRGPAMALRELISDFLHAMDERAKTGQPRPLSPRMLHNYSVDLNEFGKTIGAGVAVGEIGPRHFQRYATTIGHLAPAGHDSKVAHVMTLFRWAVKMEVVDRARFGAEFSRPSKGSIRDRRIVRRRSFTPAEVATLIDAAAGALRCMIGLGICGALTNSEVAGLSRECVDLEAGVVDFRRRKSGRIRRVVPLPPEVVADLAAYQRPDPADPAHAGLFFLTEQGNPYVRMRPGGQLNVVTTLFGRLATDCGVRTTADGRSFAGLRTTFVNLAPPGYRDEVELITGHALGTILLDHYLEDVGLVRLKHVVDHVWGQVSTLRAGAARPGSDSDDAPYWGS